MKTGRPRSTCHRCHSLALVPPGTDQRYVITRILFDEVRRRCSLIGIEEGAGIVCRGRKDGTMQIEVSGGAPHDLQLKHACFVEVRPISYFEAVA